MNLAYILGWAMIAAVPILAGLIIWVVFFSANEHNGSGDGWGGG